MLTQENRKVRREGVRHMFSAGVSWVKKSGSAEK